MAGVDYLMWLAPLSGWFFCIALLGQATAAAPPAALPEVITTKEPYFAIPFRVDRIDNPTRQPVEVQLLVSSDHGARWQIFAKSPPTQQQFLFRANGDAEYWFAIRTVDRSGQVRPERITGPALRVLVDTKRPALKLTARRNRTGAVSLNWETDKPIRSKSLSIKYRTSPDATWQAATPERSEVDDRASPRSGQVNFRPTSAEADIEVRAEVSDVAGNAANAEVQVKAERDLGPSFTNTSESRGSVAIAINPPIGNQFPALEKTSENAEPSGLPPGERPRMVNSRLFELEYDVDSIGPSGIGRVELWGTRDGGRTWRSYVVDQDKRSPILVSVDDDGIYGFRIVVTNGAGFGGKPPQSGDLPDLWVGVDITRPVARIISAEQGTDAEAGYLIITWQADDRMLAARPVSLSFSQNRNGPWLPIAAGLDNNGRYAWPLDSRIGSQFYLRLEVRDEAGNVGVHQTPAPITIDQSRPTIRVRDIRAVGPSAARPGRRS